MFRIIAIGDTLVKSYSYILCVGEGLLLVWGRCGTELFGVWTRSRSVGAAAVLRHQNTVPKNRRSSDGPDTEGLCSSAAHSCHILLSHTRFSLPDVCVFLLFASFFAVTAVILSDANSDDIYELPDK